MTFRLERTPAGVDVVVTGNWCPKARAALVNGKADGLVLNCARGFCEPDLEFLRGLPVRRLDIICHWLTDFSPLYTLGDCLVSLGVTRSPKARIDLAQFPLLTELHANWPCVKASFAHVSALERLYLGSYAERDFGPLTHLTGLTWLMMKDYPSIRSLDGMEYFPKLRELEVPLARYLADITVLERLPTRVLENLGFASCRKIVDIGPVASCTGLQDFDLSEGATIPTVAPLGGLVSLRRLSLYGSTNVVDGDLGPIAGLPNLRVLAMRDRKHYRPSAKLLIDAADQRRWAEDGTTEEEELRVEAEETRLMTEQPADWRYRIAVLNAGKGRRG